MKRQMRMILVALAAVLAACRGGEDNATQHEFSLYGPDGRKPSTISSGSDGESTILRLYSSDDWTTGAEPWITLSPSSGTAGPAQVHVSIDKNESTSVRQGAISFFADGVKKASVTVTQSGAVPSGGETVPVADLLDVEFLGSGNAQDVSAMKSPVKTFQGASLVTYPNALYSRVAAHFNHDLGLTANEGYYRVEYGSNQAMKTALSQGHSLEVLFRIDEKSTGAREVKMFSSHQAGGTGFLVSTAARGTQLTFLPNVSTTGKSNWIWTGSGINPEAGRYYHAVGVWDKAGKKACIYVDGELRGTVAAEGELVFPSEACQAFCIGGDPSSSSSIEAAWNGDVVLARAYGGALSAEQVAALYAQVKREQNPEAIHVSGISYLSGCSLSPGYKYYIYGTGFKEGDKVVLSPMDNPSLSYGCETILGEGCVIVTIPDGLVSGAFRLMLSRGTTDYPLGKAEFTVSASPPPVILPEVVAHRGAHNNSSGPYENSLESFIKAQEIGVWGSEFDVWITLDNVVVVNHNAKVMNDSRNIQDSRYEEIKDLKLGCGEKLPTLEEYLDQGLKQKGMFMVLEVKTHSTTEKNERCIEKCVELVKQRGMEAQMVWIAFSYANCLKILELLPGAKVQYLNGDRSPSALAPTGIAGIDYSYSVLSKNIGWIGEAHAENMVVNVWTVNSPQEMMKYIGLGVDYITTDNPEVCMELCSRKWVAEQ